MKTNVRIVCGADVASGLVLAGLSPLVVGDAAEAARQVRVLLETPDVAVILIEQRLYDLLPDPVRRQLARRPLPMAVPFPGPAWIARGERAEAYVVELLRRAIGYRVRLQ